MASEYSESEYEDDEDMSSIIIDNGSHTIKSGFAGDDSPSILIHKIECVTNNLLNRHPIELGMVTSWNDLEILYHYLFENKLSIESSEYGVFVTECALNPKVNKEKLTQILFESFNVPAMYIGMQPVLSLYASGRTSGIVIDSGYQHTQIVPIYEGYALSHGIQIVKYGGQQCTEYLTQLIKQQNNNIEINENDISAMKEKNCYIANDYSIEINKPILNHSENWLITGYFRNIDAQYANYTSIEIEHFCNEYCGDFNEFVCFRKKYKLPDGNVIEIGNERFKSTETTFNPQLIATILHKSILKCDVELYQNIVLAGGNTMFCGIEDRLTAEMAALTSNPVNIIANANKTYSAWIGGSILSSLSSFGEMWITIDEYEESGPGIIHPHSGM